MSADHIPADLHNFYTQVLRFSVQLYRRLELSNEWGELGENNIKSSFCRMLLQLPADQPITFENAEAFDNLVKSYVLQFELQNKTADELKVDIKAAEFTYESLTVPFEKLHEIQELFDKQCPGVVLQSGYYGEWPEVIFGKGPFSKRGTVTVYAIENEWMRSPTVLMSMAAAMTQKAVFIRKEALKNLFYQKWVPFFEETEGEASLSAEYQLSHAIKQKALASFGAFQLDRFFEKQNEWLELLQAPILYHELGHVIIQSKTLPPEIATFGEASKLFKNTFVTDLLEILADIASPKEGLKGTFSFIHEADIQTAHTYMWMYLSDAWFYDTHDEYMLGYADLACSFVLSWLKQPKKTFENRAALESLALQFVNSSYEQFCLQFKPHLDKLGGVILNCSDDQADLVLFWANLFESLQNDADFLQYNQWLSTQRTLFEAKWLSILGSSQTSIRNLVFEVAENLTKD